MLVILGLALLPALGALFQLGASLAALERMHRRAGAAEASVTVETIGSYEVDRSTMEGALRLHRVRTINARR